MNNQQRLAFIHHQLEMLMGVLAIANQKNEDENKNALFVAAKNELVTLTARIIQIQQ